jgi:thioredoxin reductase
MFYENIIIGAGPAGLQCAYYFNKFDINYVILERARISGSFFSKYPHSSNLISINKQFTGPNENPNYKLRHDWNSLLNDQNFLFKEFSQEYYPDRNDLVEYLNEYAKKFNINILYDKNVYKISKDEDLFRIKIKDSDEIYSCKKLIVATGLSKMNKSDIKINVVDPIKHYGEYPTDFFKSRKNLKEFENKKVMIIGGGNASFELANILNNVTSNIIIMTRSIREWAMVSHYSGDLRSIYLPYMDTFFLKSLNGIDRFKNDIIQTEKNGKYKVGDTPYYPDKIIFCTGWIFDNSIFDFEVDTSENNKYPKINFNYESSNVNNLYFIGALMHSRDYRKSSGGFIHGFRYLIEIFFKINYNIEGDTYKIKFNSYDDCSILTQLIMDRLTNSSELYQMYGIVIDRFCYNIKDKEIIYFKNLTTSIENLNFIYDVKFELSLEYGLNRNEYIPDLIKKFSKIGSESAAKLLHPVISVYRENKLIDVIHLDEEILTDFSSHLLYHDRIFRFLKSYLVIN